MVESNVYARAWGYFFPWLKKPRDPPKIAFRQLSQREIHIAFREAQKQEASIRIEITFVLVSERTENEETILSLRSELLRR